MSNFRHNKTQAEKLPAYRYNLLFLIGLCEKLIALDAVPRNVQMTPCDSSRKLVVMELEDVAYEDVVGVDGLKEAFWTAVEEVASEAPQLILFLVV